jgi:flagellar motility protein MotE (MotC chaperone)
MKELRLIPIVLFALSSLLALKVVDALDRGGVEVRGTGTALAEEATQAPVGDPANAQTRATRLPTAEELLGAAARSNTLVPADEIITGSGGGAPKEAPKEEPSSLGQLPISLDERKKADESAAALAKGEPDPHAAVPAEGAEGAAAGHGDAPAADAHAEAGAHAAPAEGAAAPEAAAADHAAGDAAAGDAHGADKPADAASGTPKPPLETEAPLIGGTASESERALLERLQERREELDALGRELDLRENLLRAAEKRIEERITELKRVEENIGAVQGKKEEEQKARLKGLVDMYSSMKPKDAARIFSTLEPALLVEVAAAMKPATMGPIVAAMTPEAAARLTFALANKDKEQPAPPAAPVSGLDLPKIEGTPQPTAN